MEKLILYLEYPFVRYALVVGVLIALCSSLLGVTLVLKRFSFIGDGLSHVAFGAMAVAAVLGFTNDTFFVLPVTVLCAVLLLRCQTAHCGRCKPHFIFGGLASPMVPSRNLPQVLGGMTADCRSLV